MLTIDLCHARAHWFIRQGLAGPIDGSPADVVRRTGWVRTLGGVDVYLAFRCRMAKFRRVGLDAAVGDGRVRVSPAVRGCIYLVPEDDHALALRTAELSTARRTARDLDKCGVEPGELERAGEAVVEALEQGPLTTAQIRAALPDGAVRGLGETGRKIGMSSTLPVTLRSLEFAGRIERVPVDDRLDHEQYVWRRPTVAPDLRAQPTTLAGVAAPLAARFFAFAGPATLDEFTSWSGLSKRDARAGIEACGLTPLRITGYADEAFAAPEDAERLASPVVIEAGVALLHFADNYLALRADAAAFADRAHGDRFAHSWGRGQKPLAESSYLHCRAVLDGDRLAGSWEWDPDTGAVVAETFDALPPARAEALRAEAASLTAFLRDEVGHARSTSIDNDKAQRQRLALVTSRGRV